MSDKLVNGKNNLQGIVSIEPRESDAEIFLQDKEGNITSTIVPNRSWLLSDRAIDKSFKKLEGNLHFKYGRQFDTRTEFKRMRHIWKESGDLYSIWNPTEALMVKDGYCYYKGLEPKDISILSFDIETTGLDENAKDAFVICISVTYRDKKGTQKLFFRYSDYTTQGDMIDHFCSKVYHLNPSIILGHNIISYDLKYLAAAAKRAGTTLLLGRDGSELAWDFSPKKFRVDGNRTMEFNSCRIYGREIVDTYFMAQAFDVIRTMESYKLKSMIAQLGLESEGRTFYDAATIRDNYKDPVEFEKIIAYCKDDSDDPIKLWDRMGPLFFHMGPMIPKSFQEIILGASGSKLNAMMVRAYLQDGHSIPKATEKRSFQGAHSWGKPAMYDNVLKIDVKSMYPGIIIAYNVYDEEKDPKAYLLQLTKIFREKRLEYKRLAAETGLSLYGDMDNAAKSILNSFYGFLGAPGLNFNSADCAEFITAKGREILELAITWATGKTFQDLAPEFFEEEKIEDEAV